jgi:hypothetical protein
MVVYPYCHAVVFIGGNPIPEKALVVFGSCGTLDNPALIRSVEIILNEGFATFHVGKLP